MTNNFSVSDFSTGTFMAVHGFFITEYVHADRTIRKLFVGVPGVEMGDKVVFLVKLQTAHKAFKLCLFLVMSLDMS